MDEEEIKALELTLMYCAALPNSEKQRRWEDFDKKISADEEYFDCFEDIFHMMLHKMSISDLANLFKP